MNLFVTVRELTIVNVEQDSFNCCKLVELTIGCLCVEKKVIQLESFLFQILIRFL